MSPGNGPKLRDAHQADGGGSGRLPQVQFERQSTMKNALHLTSSVTTLVSVCLMLVAMPARAEGCQKLEFAELDSLPKAELLAMRCEYATTSDLLLGTGKAGRDKISQCEDQIERMDRILIRKYKITGDHPVWQVRWACASRSNSRLLTIPGLRSLTEVLGTNASQFVLRIDASVVPPGLPGASINRSKSADGTRDMEPQPRHRVFQVARQVWRALRHRQISRRLCITRGNCSNSRTLPITARTCNGLALRGLVLGTTAWCLVLRIRTLDEGLRLSTRGQGRRD